MTASDSATAARVAAGMTTAEALASEAVASGAVAARPCLREQLGLDVDHLLPGLDIATARLRRRDGEDALRICAALVLCDPSEPRFHAGLATCALEIGVHAVALRAASAVIALTPASPLGYHLSGHAYAGLQDYDNAIADFTEALRLSCNVTQAEIARDSARMLARLAAVTKADAPA